MWLRVVLVLIATTALAGPRVKFFRMRATPGDWAAYEGQRRDNGKLVAHRAIVQATDKDNNRRLVWYQGAAGKEARFFEQKLETHLNPIEEINQIVVEITHTRTDNEVREPTLEASQCKLGDKTIDCTTLRYTVNGYDVTAELADGPVLFVIAIEVTRKTEGVFWKMHVTGFGTSKESTWGEPMPATIEQTPKTLVVTVGDVTVTGGELDKRAFRRSLMGNQLLKDCAQGAAKLGKVTVRFDVGKDGAVTSAKADGLTEINTCVADAFKRVTFATTKPSQVTAVLSFGMQ